MKPHLSFQNGEWCVIDNRVIVYTHELFSRACQYAVFVWTSHIEPHKRWMWAGDRSGFNVATSRIQ